MSLPLPRRGISKLINTSQSSRAPTFQREGAAQAETTAVRPLASAVTATVAYVLLGLGSGAGLAGLPDLERGHPPCSAEVPDRPVSLKGSLHQVGLSVEPIGLSRVEVLAFEGLAQPVQLVRDSPALRGLPDHPTELA